MNNCIPSLLEFHVFDTVHLITMVITVNINNDGKCHCRFCRTDSNREQSEEKAFKLSWEKETIEYCKIQINSVQYKFYGN